jgi:hypothetical protein
MAFAIPHPLKAQAAYTAFLKIHGDPGNQVWPAEANLPVIAFGWRGERPQPVRIAVDSGFAPFAEPGGLTTLTIQKRQDVFSPLLQAMVEQSTKIPSAEFTVYAPGGKSLVYTLFDVRVASMRDVGAVLAENPTTEELVLTFGRMAPPGQ